MDWMGQKEEPRAKRNTYKTLKISGGKTKSQGTIENIYVAVFIECPQFKKCPNRLAEHI